MKDRNGRKALFILVFIVCCHAVGLLIFCKGFLLKRVEIPEYSQCFQQTHSSRASYGGSDQAHMSCTGYPRRFKRVVWLLVDALRYDFLEYDDKLQSVPIHRNKLPYIRDLLLERPRNAKLFRFVADPPTTTMQRLKALATGGLPTFIDIGSNFNSYEILEDNLIYQSRKNSKNVTFMGDDTWLGLYPNLFNKVFDYPSLNVKDLHTVDNGVIAHLLPELEKGDADFVIAHFLGVDHVGHTYGPSHWTMGDKLSQMNNVLRSVLTSLDNDTIAFVFGDHGMTSTGDHGGETEQETNAALLIYSSRPIFDPFQPSGRSVYQIDIVPTVALVLGIPVPFSSLGMIIPEVFLPYQETGLDTFDRSSFNDGYSNRVTKDFLTALRVNSLQIQKYLTTYAQHSGDFPSDTFLTLQEDLSRALQLHENLIDREEFHFSQDELTNVATVYIDYMKRVKQMCQSVWAKFDNVSITEGLVLLLLSNVTVVLMLVDIQSGAQTLRKAIPYGAACGVGVTLALSLFLNVIHLEFSFGGIVSLALTLLLYTLGTSILVFLSLSSRTCILQLLKVKLWGSLLSVAKSLSVLTLLSVAVTVLYGVAMLSNSFVLYEGDMVTFFLQSLVVCFAWKSLQLEFKDETNPLLNKTTLIRVARTVASHVGVMVCIRMVKIFYACRDLQIQDGCLTTTFIHALPVASEFLGWLAKWRMILSCAAALSVPIAVVFVLQYNVGARHLNLWMQYVAKFGFPFSVVCVNAFWVLLCLPQKDLEALSPWQHVALPRIVYLISVVAVTLFVVRPIRSPRKVLTMNCEENPDDIDNGGVTSFEDVEREREFLDEGRTQRPRQRSRQRLNERRVVVNSSQTDNVGRVLHPSVAAVIPLTSLLLLVALWIPIVLLLNDGIALSAVIMAIQVVLTVLSLRGRESGTSWPVCVLWGLMSCQYFFGFGHHATVTSLRFEAGFVGLHGEIHTYNLPFAAVLVGLNMLGSQLLFGLGLPLLLLLDARSVSNSPPSLRLLKIILQYITFHSVKMFVTVLAASIHRRHLMVWWVFAPRFMYEGTFQITTDVCALLSYLFVCRLEHQLSAF